MLSVSRVIFLPPAVTSILETKKEEFARNVHEACGGIGELRSRIDKQSMVRYREIALEKGWEHVLEKALEILCDCSERDVERMEDKMAILEDLCSHLPPSKNPLFSEKLAELISHTRLSGFRERKCKIVQLLGYLAERGGILKAVCTTKVFQECLALANRSGQFEFAAVLEILTERSREEALLGERVEPLRLPLIPPAYFMDRLLLE